MPTPLTSISTWPSNAPTGDWSAQAGTFTEDNGYLTDTSSDSVNIDLSALLSDPPGTDVIPIPIAAVGGDFSESAAVFPHIYGDDMGDDELPAAGVPLGVIFGLSGNFETSANLLNPNIQLTNDDPAYEYSLLVVVDGVFISNDSTTFNPVEGDLVFGFVLDGEGNALVIQETSSGTFSTVSSLPIAGWSTSPFTSSTNYAVQPNAGNGECIGAVKVYAASDVL